MQERPDDTVDALRAVWAADEQSRDDLDEVCGPQKTCKNMVGVGFDGWAEAGADLRTAWRTRLEREGKLNASGETLRDLVLGASSSE